MPVLNTAANSAAVLDFLITQGLAIDQFLPESLLADYLAEMAQGLSHSGSSSLKMIPTYVSSDKQFLRSQAALVLDAGGSNLRCALVTVPESGAPLIESFRKCEMPALKQQLSAAEFFAEIAEFMAPALEEYAKRYGQGPECLGFCFSYPSQILMTENGDLDGKLLQWSKEIKVPELVGQYVGSGLLAMLREKFGKLAPRHVYIVNDTIATLLAGQSAAGEIAYSDFIGYILGTGINSCHAEPSSSIAALDSRYKAPRAIVNVESGNYQRFPQSSIDKQYDALTQNPGSYLQEKACSGRYWGELVCMALRVAAHHNFEGDAILPAEFAHLPLQSSAQINSFLQNPSKCGGSFTAWLDEQQVDINARERTYLIVEAMLERSALFTAINMAACILRSGGGHSPLYPVCLTVDGSTFYALHKFQHRVCSWLDDMLCLSKGRKRYYNIVTVENAPLLGAAIAVLGFNCQ